MKAEELKSLRENAGITQKELAEALGYAHKSMICRWEKGYDRIHPRAEKLVNLYFNQVAQKEQPHGRSAWDSAFWIGLVDWKMVWSRVRHFVFLFGDAVGDCLGEKKGVLTNPQALKEHQVWTS